MISQPPAWGLTLAYSLHLLATVAWLGSMVLVDILFVPSARLELTEADTHKLVARLQKTLGWVGWMCLGVLGATGMFQMSAHPSYQGFLAIENTWSVAIFSKHLVVLVMVAAQGYLTWGLAPLRRRLEWLRGNAADGDDPGLRQVERRERAVRWVNLGLALVVLILTALARSS
jgi:uncharacterized membrane protein